MRKVLKNKSSILAVILSESPSDSSEKDLHGLVELLNFSVIVDVTKDGSPFFFEIIAELLVCKFLYVLENILHIEHWNSIII